MAQRRCRVCSGNNVADPFHDMDEPWPDACLGHFRSTEKSSGIQVIRDIDPYRSIIDKSVIGGRKQHRDHLRAHGCIEIGNEKPGAHVPTDVPGVRRDIKRSMEELRGR